MPLDVRDHRALLFALLAGACAAACTGDVGTGDGGSARFSLVDAPAGVSGVMTKRATGPDRFDLGMRIERSGGAGEVTASLVVLPEDMGDEAWLARLPFPDCAIEVAIDPRDDAFVDVAQDGACAFTTGQPTDFEFALVAEFEGHWVRDDLAAAPLR